MADPREAGPSEYRDGPSEGTEVRTDRSPAASVEPERGVGQMTDPGPAQQTPSEAQATTGTAAEQPARESEKAFVKEQLSTYLARGALARARKELGQPN